MNDDNTSMTADECNRKEALDISKSFIIQAPAGSGKTEILIQRYLKLLASVSQPEEIVAITFTNKAANEMKQRVLSAMAEAVSGIEPAKDYQIKTRQYANEVLRRDRKKSWNLTHAHKRMKILTLDSLCSDIVNKSPVTSKFGFGKKLLSNHELKSIYRLAAISSLNSISEEFNGTPDAEKLLIHLDGNLYRYIDYLEKMLGTRDQWMDIVGSGANLDKTNQNKLRKQLERNIQNLIIDHHYKLIALFPEKLFLRLPSVFNFIKENNDNFSYLPELTSASMLDSYDANNSWCCIADLLLTKSGAWRKTVNIKNGFSVDAREEKKEIKDIINELSDVDNLREVLHAVRSLPGSSYDDQQWAILITLFKLLPYVVAELKNIFAQKNIADFIEMADCARLALGDVESPTDLALILDYKLKHILVDEMQDTSTRQYQFLEALTRGWEERDERTLFLVGDPMQSIFRFRNAQVSQFIVCSKRGIGDVSLKYLVLNNNYRSGTELVNQFNHTFTQVFPFSEDLIRGAITYTNAIAGPGKINPGEYKVHTLFNSNKQKQATYTAEVIKNKLENTSGSIAILVRSRPQLTLLLSQLRQENINYNAVEIDRLTDLPEIIDLLALTRALCHKEDKAAWLGLLRGPMVGLTWIELVALMKNAKKQSIWSLLQDKKSLKVLSKKNQSQLIKFCKKLSPYVDTGSMRSLRDRVELAWYGLNGPALIVNKEQLENIQKYFNALEVIDVGGSLEDSSELEEKIDEIRVSSIDHKEVRIHVMTIHKAKGLEFDHVILPSIEGATRPTEKSVVNWLSRPTDSISDDIVISPIGSNDTDKLHSYIQKTIKDGEALELDRLLYVAYTRARESLDVIGNVKVKQNDIGLSLYPPSKLTLLGRLWPSLKATYEYNMQSANISFDEPSISKSVYIEPSLKRINDIYLTPFGTSFPKIESFGLNTEIAETNKIEFSWVGENAKNSGIIIHRWLQKISQDNKIPSLNEISSLDPMLANWARNIFVKDDQLADVLRRVYSAIQSIIEDTLHHKIILGEGFSELALTGIWDNKRYSVVIDRIHIDRDKQHWVIDYKTGTHEGSFLSEFIDSEVVRYKDQLSKYAEIYKNYSGFQPKVALYFPSLKTLRVVEI